MTGHDCDAKPIALGAAFLAVVAALVACWHDVAAVNWPAVARFFDLVSAGMT
jgi:hypothetical protein